MALKKWSANKKEIDWRNEYNENMETLDALQGDLKNVTISTLHISQGETKTISVPKGSTSLIYAGSNSASVFVMFIVTRFFDDGALNIQTIKEHTSIVVEALEDGSGVTMTPEWGTYCACITGTA